MKIAVLGSTGMLGHKMVERLQLHFPDVVGVSRKMGLDATHPVNFQSMLAIQPEIVINCIGIIKQRPQELEESIAVNSLFPHSLQRICSLLGAHLIHFSTDCVFSGRKLVRAAEFNLYEESDLSDADDTYGRTKYLGEVTAENALTIRTSIIGREKSNFKGLLEWFLRQEGYVTGHANAIFSGVTTNWLSDTVAQLIKRGLFSGLYHVAAPPISKSYLLELIQDVYRRRRDVKIISSQEPVCDRSLYGNKFVQATGIVTPPLAELVAMQKEQDRRSGYAF